jgi:chromosomal replication initiation ATPase DnaA
MSIISRSVAGACEYADVSFSEIACQTKNRIIVRHRWAFWYHLVVRCDWTLPMAGRRTGHDHTTVLYGVRKHAEEVLGTDADAGLEDIRQAAQAPLEEAA